MNDSIKPRRNPAGDYEVGYCRPPKGSQFQKGKSGNPAGRRRKAQPEPMRSASAQVAARTQELLQENPDFLAKALLKALANGKVSAFKIVRDLLAESESGKTCNCPGPVLVVPGMATDIEAWLKHADEAQAQYR